MTTYSHSRLNTFENCPLQYKLHYIDGIERDEEGIEMFVGSRFHEVMDKLYRDLHFKTYSLEELFDFYEAQWKKEYNKSVIITKKDRTVADYKNIGRKCIESYYKRYHPFTQSRTLGVEREVIFDLDDKGRYKFRGFIDRLAQTDDGTYQIHDYKTSGYLPDQKHFEEDKQLAFYQIGVKKKWNDVKDVKLIWHYVVFDKEMVSSRSHEQLERLKKDAISLIDRIENTKEFIPKESSLCDWCVFPDLCPKRKHLYRVETLPVNEYLKDSGVKLVNTFTELAVEKKDLQDKIDVIDGEIDKIREAVIEYSKKEGVDVIRGSDHKLKVSEKTKVSAPSKNTPERKELEEVIRESHKWDEVSTLDASALEKVVIEETWDKKIINKIKKFLSIENRKSVSLSKLQEKEK